MNACINASSFFCSIRKLKWEQHTLEISSLKLLRFSFV